ncbi:MAG: hypothetical protein OSA43_08525 [Pirellulales bacterium]|jgi:hypothetical protein|nr:hypothetical protein [Pirellulales bacterium]
MKSVTGFLCSVERQKIAFAQTGFNEPFFIPFIFSIVITRSTPCETGDGAPWGKRMALLNNCARVDDHAPV